MFFWGRVFCSVWKKEFFFFFFFFFFFRRLCVYFGLLIGMEDGVGCVGVGFGCWFCFWCWFAFVCFGLKKVGSMTACRGALQVSARSIENHTKPDLAPFQEETNKTHSQTPKPKPTAPTQHPAKHLSTAPTSQGHRALRHRFTFGECGCGHPCQQQGKGDPAGESGLSDLRKKHP